MQISVRTILVFTLFCGLLARFWPDPNRGPRAAYHLFVLLSCCLALTCLFGSSAYRRARRRIRSANAGEGARERASLVLAAAGVLPFVAVWLFAMVEPFEPLHIPWLPVALEVVWFTSWCMYLPSLLCLLLSCYLFRGRAANPAFFWVRALWLGLSLGLPIWVIGFVLPHLR